MKQNKIKLCAHLGAHTVWKIKLFRFSALYVMVAVRIRNLSAKPKKKTIFIGRTQFDSDIYQKYTNL